MDSAVGKETPYQVARAARTRAFAWVAQQVNAEWAMEILMGCTNAPARRQAAAQTADSRLENYAAHRVRGIKIMSGFLPSNGIPVPTTFCVTGS